MGEWWEHFGQTSARQILEGRGYDGLHLTLRVFEGRRTNRSSLDDARTGERPGFVSIDALLAFLREQTGVVTDLLEDENAAGE